MNTEILKKFGYFSSENIEIFEQSLIKRTVQKGDILLKQGQVCQTLYFIEKGALIEYNLKMKSSKISLICTPKTNGC